MAKKLFVGGLPFDFTDEQLRELFSPHGTVLSAVMVPDPKHGRTRGFGFVAMSSEEETLAAAGKMKGTRIGEKEVWVTEAREKAKQPERPTAPFPKRERSPDNRSRPSFSRGPQRHFREDRPNRFGGQPRHSADPRFAPPAGDDPQTSGPRVPFGRGPYPAPPYESFRGRARSGFGASSNRSRGKPRGHAPSSFDASSRESFGGRSRKLPPGGGVWKGPKSTGRGPATPRSADSSKEGRPTGPGFQKFFKDNGRKGPAGGPPRRQRPGGDRTPRKGFR